MIILLNYECRKILNKIRRLTASNTKHIDFLDIVHSFPISKQGKWALKLEDLLFYLHENEYIHYLLADDTFYHISLTYKGLAYLSFDYERIKEIIFNSFLLPMLVAFVTSIISCQAMLN